jgi:hypothetical protein
MGRNLVEPVTARGTFELVCDSAELRPVAVTEMFPQRSNAIRHFVDEHPDDAAKIRIGS